MAISPALTVMCMTPETSEKRGCISGWVGESEKLKLDLGDIEKGGSGVVYTRPRPQHAPLSVFVDDD